MDKPFYLGNADGKVIGPYHPDEISAYANGRTTLGYPGTDVYRINATSREDARSKLATAVDNARRQAQTRAARQPQQGS